ncbi:MAG: gluconokinase [cyanobacterium endosymbiont of Rhopalodia sterrenbergii]
MIYIIMGVSGSGKTTVGKQLSFHLDYHFYDADNFHPPENIQKMSRGIPLDDKDRQPWLLSLSRLINNLQQHQENAVIACSSLKKSYRKLLQNNYQDLVWIYLKGSFEQILERLDKRKEHFMTSKMLKSQFKDLEEPDNAIILDIGSTTDQTIKQVLSKIALS